MALNVYLLFPGEKVSVHSQLITQFDDDGYFWYLWDYWPASSSTGKTIDLYNDAVFKGTNLPQLRGCLTRAVNSLVDRPEIWKVSTGTGAGRKPIYETVEKTKVSLQLSRMLEGIKRAEAEDMEIHFKFD